MQYIIRVLACTVAMVEIASGAPLQSSRTGQDAPINGIQSNRTGLDAPINGIPSNQGPIWFARMPSDGDTHSTSFLYCRMAHNGHSRWAETESGSARCCFCLADTQRIGCVHGTCPRPSRTEVADKRLAQADQTVGRFATYSECVRAHGGNPAFADGCNRCICSADGTVICTLKKCPTPAPEASNTAVPSSPTPWPSFGSYEGCVRANGGNASFKRNCNGCRCLQGGAVECTRRSCLHTTLH
ncbi:hypothetical protein EV175_000083 [Coemansia sp. RSA 1933]|nr:hypothetical protein EV175_000083 [Coemansia sp. RSA 1933]